MSHIRVCSSSKEKLKDVHSEECISTSLYVFAEQPEGTPDSMTKKVASHRVLPARAPKGVRGSVNGRCTKESGVRKGRDCTSGVAPVGCTCRLHAWVAPTGHTRGLHLRGGLAGCNLRGASCGVHLQGAHTGCACGVHRRVAAAGSTHGVAPLFSCGVFSDYDFS